MSLLTLAGFATGSVLGSHLVLAAVAMAAAWGGLGALVLTGVPDHRVARLIASAGVLSTVALLSVSWSRWLPSAWVSQWLWWPPYCLMVLALLYFPDGRLPSPRWRGVSLLLVAATICSTVALAAAAVDHPGDLVADIDAPVTSRAQALLLVAVAAGVIAVPVGLVAVLITFGARWRRADVVVRRQLGCLATAIVVLLASVVLDGAGLSGAWALTAVAVPLGMTTAILRYHLYDLDLIINRSIVWLIMTLLVVVGFLGIVALLRDVVLGADSTPQASLLATGVIAVGFEPLHLRVQRLVNRFLYGERDDPYSVVARLGDLVGRTMEANALLPEIVKGIAASLRVPYVAIEVNERNRSEVLAESGRVAARSEVFPLMSHGQQLGQLRVATRSPGSPFLPRERRLLTSLAIQAAAAVEATRLARDLQASRERLVTGREEERRRLRRDLHDGLGPSLAGMSMQVQAAHRLIAGSDGTCHVHLRELRILESLALDLQRCALEVRRLVDELRPPALDHGLESALRAQVRQFDSGSVSVSLAVSGTFTGIPAAVEVAAYRIVAESLTNMARHAHASQGSVRVHAGQALRLEIVDNGDGLRSAGSDGVGLLSIRERAAELGGACDISSPSEGGTRVSVELPLGEFTPQADATECAVGGPLLAAAASISVGDSGGYGPGPDEDVTIPPQVRPETVV